MTRVRAALVFWVWLLAASVSLAQTDQPSLSELSADWQELSSRTEAAIDRNLASSVTFENIRAEVAAFRRQFLDLQSTNRARIETVQRQLEALGPEPGEGIEEAADIASRRAELNARLEDLRAPQLAADEAYTQADGLIREIDAIIRDRQAEALIELGPSPLNPIHWTKTLEELAHFGRGVVNELITNIGNETRLAEIRENLILSIASLVIGGLLLFRGRSWTERAGDWIEHNTSPKRRDALSYVLSLGQILLPFLGIAFLVGAVRAADMFSLRGDAVLQVLPSMVFFLFTAFWIAGQAFPRSEVREPPLNLEPKIRAGARWTALVLGAILAVDLLVVAVTDAQGGRQDMRAVLQFPLIVLSGIFLWRMSRTLRRHVKNDAVEDEAPGIRNRIINVMARIVLAIAITGPVVAAIGYGRLAEALVFPAIYSLGLFAFVASLQRFVHALYRSLNRHEDTVDQALIPVLLGFVIGIASVPLFALIWGARVSDLTEIWTRFLAGLQVGDTRISPADFLTFAIVFVIGYTLTRVLQGTLRVSVLPKTKIDAGGRNAIVSGIGYVGIFVAALVAIGTAGLDLSSIAIVAGALSVGIGFGLQTIVSNFVSGIILLIERPITEGDWIEVGGEMGVVRAISVRSTRIETFDRRDVIVPNSDLISGTVTNWTRNNLNGRLIVSVGVAYGTDTEKVETILREICEAHPLVMVTPPPSILFRGFGADSLDFEARMILSDVNYLMSAHSELNHSINKRFLEEGIEIPFAQRDVWLRNPETLSPGAASAS